MHLASPINWQAHPQASLIPLAIGQRYFNYNLSDDLIQLMQIETNEALLECLKTYDAPKNVSHKKNVWLALVISHPQLSIEQLNEIGAYLTLSKKHLYQLACITGNLPYLEILDASDETGVLDYFKGFHLACENGELKVLEFLSRKYPENLQPMINEREFFGFKVASENGHFEVLQFLANNNPEQIQAMIKAQDFFAFKAAAKNGHFEVLQFLANNNPDQIQAMIEAQDYFAFNAAAENGHFEVLQFLANNNPEQIQAMIEAQDFFAFNAAAENGHIKVIQWLFDKAPNQIKTIITTDYFYTLFYNAARINHHEILQFLIKQAPGKLKRLVDPEFFHTLFLIAAENGYIEVIELLADNAPIQLIDMIKHNDYNAFKYAAQNGCLEVLQYLAEKADGQLQSMIMAQAFSAFRYAAQNNHLTVLEFLAKNAADKLEEMISSEDFYAFKNTCKKITRHFFLSHPAVFIYAEEHKTQTIGPFLSDLFSALYKEKIRNPDAIFDVDNQQKVQLLFYSLRYLIRMNHPDNNYWIEFLLAIPKLKAIVHTQIRQGASNELLRLALTMENRSAALLLMNIPEVSQLARENNYYEDEQQCRLNLRELAQNDESSMTGLTNGEEKRLKNVKTHYQHIHGENWLDSKEKIDACIDMLREELKFRYLACPGRIKVGDQEIKLPLTWEEFQSLNLNEIELTQALQTYYKHPDHTAWRYLAKPNPWLHQNAMYPSETGDRCSTFESYNELIALLYVAASDKEIPDTEGYTHPARLTLFIQELALIGRTHNWDKTRGKTDENQNLLFDDAGESIIEEYDDNEGDNPSCFSGTKRRLFQSLLGTPLLIPLTKDKLIMELEDTVKDHFQQVITASNRVAIKAIWDKTVVAEDLTNEEIGLLQTLNISEEQQKKFIDNMETRYGEDFSQDACFIDLIKKAFELPGYFNAHLLNFGHLRLDRFMNEPIKSEGTNLSEARQHFGLFKKPKEENLIQLSNLNPNQGSSSSSSSLNN